MERLFDEVPTIRAIKDWIGNPYDILKTDQGKDYSSLEKRLFGRAAAFVFMLIAVLYLVKNDWTSSPHANT